MIRILHSREPWLSRHEQNSRLCLRRILKHSEHMIFPSRRASFGFVAPRPWSETMVEGSWHMLDSPTTRTRRQMWKVSLTENFYVPRQGTGYWLRLGGGGKCHKFCSGISVPEWLGHCCFVVLSRHYVSGTPDLWMKNIIPKFQYPDKYWYPDPQDEGQEDYADCKTPTEHLEDV